MKAITAHTPGPWRIGDAGHTVFGPKTALTSPVSIVTLWQRTPNCGREERQANAHLIAASPELLAALVEALPWVEAQLDDPVNKPGSVQAVANRIRAAIAKAEGRTN